VQGGLPTSNISDAALFRAIDEKPTPTLLLDEVDAIFGPKARDREDLRGMLNAGYRRGAVARRMGGARYTELQAFSVFCPKAFALIGELPDTIADRAIRIRLERRTTDETIERFRRRDVAPGADSLRDTIADWCEPRLDELHASRPHLPDELDDRAQDCWEPLLALADLAGGDWPNRAHRAALALSGPQARQDEDASLTARLLKDIHQVFSVNGSKRYRTADLIAELCKIEESPWGDWYGKTISPQAVSKLLQPHRIKTMSVKVDGETVRGYKEEQFANAFHRVLGVTGVTSVTSRMTPQATGNEGNAGNAQQTKEDEPIPIPGDTDFPNWIDQKCHERHVTEQEWLGQRKLHARLAGAPARYGLGTASGSVERFPRASLCGWRCAPDGERAARRSPPTRPYWRYTHDWASKTLLSGLVSGRCLYLSVYPIASELFVHAGCRRTAPPMLGLKEPF
jgi:hypothetical protein